MSLGRILIAISSAAALTVAIGAATRTIDAAPAAPASAAASLVSPAVAPAHASVPAASPVTAPAPGARPKASAVAAPAPAAVRIATPPASAAAAPATSATSAPKLSFNRDIRPLFSDTCFKCHGFDAKARKAHLRLDVREEAIRPRKDITPIVPGHPEKSEAWLRLISTDPDDQMPPPDSHLTLTPAQIATVKLWIQQGAEYQPHWAFIAPKDEPVPAVKDAAWARNPIDNFILARLTREGLAPSPQADRRTLIRRVSLDLIGLPPTAAQVEAFVSDPDPQAYDKLVDRLLASPAYGENMAIPWLDAARYADSNGYQGDPTRTMWPWRDWVVSAMNANMPFDQFAVDQIAGDLLPNATPQERLASGFNRNHTYNGEGGRIAEETRVENVLDRVDTTSTAFLGLTIGCAKCHDHKFDPIKQKEYYSLFAYFNQCSESGANPSYADGNVAPMMIDASPEAQKKLAELKADQQRAQQALAAALPAIDLAQAAWEKDATAPGQWAITVPSGVSSSGGTWMRMIDDGTVLCGGSSPATDVQEVTLKTELIGITAFRLDALTYPSLPQGGPGRSPDSGNFVLTRVEGDATSLSDPKQKIPLVFSGAYASYSQPGFSPTAPISPNAGKVKTSGWAVWKAKNKNNLWASFTFAQPLGFAGGTEIHLRFHYESSFAQHTMGHFRVALGTGPQVPPDVREALRIPALQRDKARKDRIRDYFRTEVSTSYKSLNNRAAIARKATGDFDKALPRVMVMDDATPRVTHVLLRGQYDKPGDRVEPGVPAFLPPLPRGMKNNRLALARWIVDPANPLTARVIVNRYWQQFFGIGIVKTSDDFGTQGEAPVHPELLDYLAHRFVASGWNVKAMQKLMVTSATYRQRSDVSGDLYERDPDNRLLARGPRYRLTSFAIRDQALAASGLLVRKVGGAPVRPYQPPGVWEEMSLGEIKYVTDTGESLYRRSLYTFWRRTVAPTTMFDVSSRASCVVRPMRTNTPLQALALLNDTTYVEAARFLSQTLLEDPSTTPSQKLDQVFLRFMARRPSAAERAILLNALDRLRREYKADPAGAAKLIAVGEKPVDAKLDPAELASWTALVNTIMNMDEVITKE
jgi:hypothetical protein